MEFGITLKQVCYCWKKSSLLLWAACAYFFLPFFSRWSYLQLISTKHEITDKQLLVWN